MAWKDSFGMYLLKKKNILFLIFRALIDSKGF